MPDSDIFVLEKQLVSTLGRTDEMYAPVLVGYTLDLREAKNWRDTSSVYERRRFFQLTKFKNDHST